MINELIIHLGDTKTGSTSIQKALVQGAFHAPGKTISYPTKSHHKGLGKTLTQKRFFSERDQRFSKLKKVFQDSEDTYGVISAEHFQVVDPLLLQHAIETYWPEFRDRLRLVAYVRPHGGKFLSSFSERIKLGAPAHSLEDFFEVVSQGEILDYTPRFKKWREVFGDRFQLHLFERKHLYKGDVVQDFLRYVFESEEFEMVGDIMANQSLTLSQLALLREVQSHLTANRFFRKGPRFSEAAGSLGRLVAEHMQKDGLGSGGEKLRMPAALVDRFKRRFAADAEALDTAFFDGFPLSDALEGLDRETTDKAQSLAVEDHFQAEAIRGFRVFANVLADLLLANPDQFKQAVLDIRTAEKPGQAAKG